MSSSQPGDTHSDPLIDEVRAIRKAISDQFDNDVDRLCEHLRQLERQHPDRLVQPEKPAKSQGTRVTKGSE